MADLAEHYRNCEETAQLFDLQGLLEALYLTHCLDEGPKTANMRKAILVRLDRIKGIDYVER